MQKVHVKRLISILIELFFVMSFVSVSFAVSDVTDPVISDVSIDKQGETLEPGDTFTLRFKAEDESGISSVISYISHSVGGQSLPNSRPNYNNTTGHYEVVYTVPGDTVNGVYQLDYISVSDTYRNGTTRFFTDMLHWVNVTDASTVHVDGIIGVPSDGKILEVPSGKKYQIRADYGRWANYWYQIESDGFVGGPITSQTKYTDVPILIGTSINGLSNGYHYTLMEVRETATPTEKVEIPGMPAGTNYVVYELSPFDSMYEYLTSQKEFGETTIGSYDIDVSGSIPSEGVLVSFNVGWRHRNKTLNVLHYHNNEVHRYEGIVDRQGVLTIRVYGFSPFMIVEPAAPTPPAPEPVSSNASNSSVSTSDINRATYTVTMLDNGNAYTEISSTKQFPGGGVYMFRTDAAVYVDGELIKPDSDGIYSVIVNRHITISLGSVKTSVVADVPATGGMDASVLLYLITAVGCAALYKRKRSYR